MCPQSIAQRKRQSPPAPTSQPLTSASQEKDLTVTTRRLRSRAAASLAPAKSCRRARGGVTRVRHSFVAAARSLSAVRRAQRLALSACGRWRGRFLSWGGRRCAALTAPLPGAVAVARRSRRPCLRRRAGAPGAGSAVPPRSRRRNARPPLFALSARCAVLSGSRSLRVVVGAVASSLGAVAVARHSRRRCLRRRGGAPSASSIVPPRSRRRGARPPFLFVAAPYSHRAVRSAIGSLSLRVNVGAGASSLGAVAVARCSRRRCPRHRAGAPSAGLAVPPRSRRRGAWPPLFHGDGSLSRRSASCSAARALCVWTLEQSLPLCGRSPLRGAHGAAACGASLALLAPPQSCRCARGGVALGRRSFVAAACSLGAVRNARRLVLSACGRWRGRFLAGGIHRRAAFAAPLPVALWRRAGAHSAGLVVPPRSRRHDARPSPFCGGGSLSRRGA